MFLSNMYYRWFHFHKSGILCMCLHVCLFGGVVVDVVWLFLFLFLVSWGSTLRREKNSFNKQMPEGFSPEKDTMPVFIRWLASNNQHKGLTVSNDFRKLYFSNGPIQCARQNNKTEVHQIIYTQVSMKPEMQLELLGSIEQYSSKNLSHELL